VSEVADVSGWYADVGGNRGSTHNWMTSARVLDTRVGLGGTTGPVSGGQTIDLGFSFYGTEMSDVTAVVLNVTAIHAGGPESYLTVYPAGRERPLASNLNFVAGQTAANLVTVPVSSDGKVSFTTTAARSTSWPTSRAGSSATGSDVAVVAVLRHLCNAAVTATAKNGVVSPTAAGTACLPQPRERQQLCPEPVSSPRL
jgi:hypothetical protein